MKASPIRNRPVNTHGNSMKKLTALSFVTLLALVGAPRAWGQAACTGGCNTTQSGNNAIYTFTGTGTFKPTAPMTVTYLVVAGGGGGGGNIAYSGGTAVGGGGVGVKVSPLRAGGVTGAGAGAAA